MGDLDEMLGESDCLEGLVMGFDNKRRYPKAFGTDYTQSTQGTVARLTRHPHNQRKRNPEYDPLRPADWPRRNPEYDVGRTNPELGKINLGRMVKGIATGGISEIARSRLGKAVLTGGVSEVARGASKLLKGGKKAVGKVTAKVPTIAKAALTGAVKGAVSAKASAGPPITSAALPEIRIRVMPCDSPCGGGGGSSSVAQDVARKISPEMAHIKTVLDKMQLQNKVTSEHNAIKRRNKFQKQVLKRLADISVRRGINFKAGISL